VYTHAQSHSHSKKCTRVGAYNPSQPPSHPHPHPHTRILKNLRHISARPRLLPGPSVASIARRIRLTSSRAAARTRSRSSPSPCSWLSCARSTRSVQPEGRDGGGEGIAETVVSLVEVGIQFGQRQHSRFRGVVGIQASGGGSECGATTDGPSRNAALCIRRTSRGCASECRQLKGFLGAGRPTPASVSTTSPSRASRCASLCGSPPGHFLFNRAMLGSFESV
jgi:hypothetical protein